MTSHLAPFHRSANGTWMSVASVENPTAVQILFVGQETAFSWSALLRYGVV